MSEQPFTTVQLEFRAGPRGGDTATRTQNSLTVGRSDQADVTVPDRNVSRYHCRLFVEADQWYVEDLGSTNGTYVNGFKIRGQQPLTEGDHLAVHECVFIFHTLESGVATGGAAQNVSSPGPSAGAGGVQEPVTARPEGGPGSPSRTRGPAKRRYWIALGTALAVFAGLAVFAYLRTSRQASTSRHTAQSTRGDESSTERRHGTDNNGGFASQPDQPPPGSPGVPDEGNSGADNAPQKARPWTVPGLNLEMVWLDHAGFWAGKYEVSNAQFRVFRENHRSGRFKGHALDKANQPVVRVAPVRARRFARWLTRRERRAGRLPTGWVYRLPSVEQWRTLAAVDPDQRYLWGDQWPPPKGNLRDRSWPWQFTAYISGYDDGYEVSCPVHHSGVNEHGVYGALGNVWEVALSPSASHEPPVRLMGGSWMTWVRDLLRTGRQEVSVVAGLSEHSTAPDAGFRVVLVPAR